MAQALADEIAAAPAQTRLVKRYVLAAVIETPIST